MAKTICDNCIHDEVCGLEGHLDEALTFCANKAADVKPVIRAKWDGYVCQNCNVSADYFISGNEYYFDEKPHFCPNCGADMRNDSNLMETEVEGLFLNFEQGENND